MAYDAQWPLATDFSLILPRQNNSHSTFPFILLSLPWPPLLQKLWSMDQGMHVGERQLKWGFHACVCSSLFSISGHFHAFLSGHQEPIALWLEPCRNVTQAEVHLIWFAVILGVPCLPLEVLLKGAVEGWGASPIPGGRRANRVPDVCGWADYRQEMSALSSVCIGGPWLPGSRPVWAPANDSGTIAHSAWYIHGWASCTRSTQGWQRTPTSHSALDCHTPSSSSSAAATPSAAAAASKSSTCHLWLL